MSKGLVVREGMVDLLKVRKYADRNKLPFIDLRQDLLFSSEEHLSNYLSMKISNTFKRPLRATLNSFFSGECFGKTFVAVLPYNFLTEFAMTIKKAPMGILEAITNNEATIN
ncbi:MAG TPA: hypothetical protein VI790_04210 [Candidatus Nanoarchaeia archaeon]|nr:hypothetical protein [Candidatus Nanoarchaeia archaeon]